MKTKFKIVETVYYYLAVSDEEIKKSDWVIFLDRKLLYNVEYNSQLFDYNNDTDCKKIVAYLPKNNAPELDLSLLPEIDSVNYVRSLAASKFPINSTSGMMEMLNREQLNNSLKQEGFIEGYKAATKIYTEQDMIMAAKYGYEFRDTTSFPEHKFEDSCINNFKQKLQSLNQPQTPTHFEAETKQHFEPDKNKRFNKENGVYYKLKTELINGKERLVGKYLFE